MKEARIILPSFGNNGEDLNGVHEWLKQTLSRKFDGFTVTPGQGGYRMASGAVTVEGVRVYDVAAAPSDCARKALVQIAARAARLARQETVYLRTFDGDVLLINAQSDVARGPYHSNDNWRFDVVGE